MVKSPKKRLASIKRKSGRKTYKVRATRKTRVTRKTRKSPVSRADNSVISRRKTIRTYKRVTGRSTRNVRKTKASRTLHTKWQLEHNSVGIGPLLRGKMSHYGYHSYVPKNQRMQALQEAVHDYGALSVFRSLNALAVYNKNTNPEAAKVFKADRDAVHDMYM